MSNNAPGSGRPSPQNAEHTDDIPPQVLEEMNFKQLEDNADEILGSMVERPKSDFEQIMEHQFVEEKKIQEGNLDEDFMAGARQHTEIQPNLEEHLPDEDLLRGQIMEEHEDNDLLRAIPSQPKK